MNELICVSINNDYIKIFEVLPSSALSEFSDFAESTRDIACFFSLLQEREKHAIDSCSWVRDKWRKITCRTLFYFSVMQLVLVFVALIAAVLLARSPVLASEFLLVGGHLDEQNAEVCISSCVCDTYIQIILFAYVCCIVLTNRCGFVTCSSLHCSTLHDRCGEYSSTEQGVPPTRTRWCALLALLDLTPAVTRTHRFSTTSAS